MSESTEFDANYGSGNMAKSGSVQIVSLDGMMCSVYEGNHSPVVFHLQCLCRSAPGPVLSLCAFSMDWAEWALGLTLRFTLVKSFDGRELPDVSY